MSAIAIAARGISKKYQIRTGGRTTDTGLLRDAIARTATAPFRYARQVARGGRVGSDEGQPADFWALHDVSFDVRHGESVGIVGRNGAGKSTLLKILSRVTDPTSGRAVISGRMASLLEIGTGFHPELTGRENIFLNGAILGMGRREIARKFDEIVAFAEIEKFIDTPVKFYSSGMYVRLAFAVAAHLDPDILVIDEVLAVGDAAFQKKCLRKMDSVAKHEGRTLVFVTHNLSLLEAICSRAYLLHAGRVVASGSTGEVVQRYLALTVSEGHSYRMRSDALEYGGIVNAGDLIDLRSDSDIDLAIALHAGERDLKDLSIDIAVRNDKDDVVLHAMSRFVSSGLSLVGRSRSIVQWKIKSPKLAPGQYYLEVYVEDAAGTVMWVENIAAFSINAASYFGVLEVIPDIKSPIVAEFEMSVAQRTHAVS
jgi:lipopolysaccharide transport system ATP-binding protein